MNFFSDELSAKVIHGLCGKVAKKQFNKYLPRAIETQAKIEYLISRPLVDPATELMIYAQTEAQNTEFMTNLLQKAPSFPQALSNGYHINLRNTISQKISEGFFAEKVHSQPELLGNSIEIKFERTKESLEKIGLMKELGTSMLLDPGRKVG
ncbi:MAG: hypothetical protein P8Y97_22690, partial [Candidatus Lokiarchaeota archaeon]